MISALLVFAQIGAPVLPLGVSPEFSAQVLSVERQLEAGDFAAASTALQNLPAASVKIAWNDSTLSADQKEGFATARDQAFASWKRVMPQLALEVSDSGPLAFKFAPTTGVKLSDGIATGMDWKIERPRMDVTIGLSRGNPLAPTNANGVHNDVVRAIGHYLGLGDSPFSGGGMYPTHWATNRSVLMPQDGNSAAANLQALTELRQAAAASQKITPTQPKLELSSSSYDAGKLLQGEEKQFSVSMKNEGTGPLKLWVKPECGCIVAQGVQTIAPGETRQLNVNFDFREFEGDVHKKIHIVSNDPTQPVRHIEIKAQVAPMYRFLMPQGPVAILGDGGGKAEVFLTFKDVEPFKIKRFEFNGINGRAQVEPWTGKLADPQKGEADVARKGYKFTIDIADKLPPGRSPGTLMIATESRAFPILMFTFQAQKGIVALPDELYWGELTGPKQAKFLVSRPGRPFKVTSVSSESPALTASFKETATGDFAIDVEYDGKGPKGEWITALLVKTDDPKQPVVRVPVVATVK